MSAETTTTTGARPQPSSTARTRIRSWIAGHVRRREVVVAVITLATFLASPPKGTTTLALVAAAGFLLGAPWLARDWRAWTGLLALASWGTLREPWFDLDNHHVLILYWFAALALTCRADDPARALACAARWLIAAVFVFATAWKLLSPDFADTSFLTYVLSTDRNVDRVATATGWHEDEPTANREAIAIQRRDVTRPLEPVELAVASRTAAAAPALTLAALALEAAVALAFLAPLRGRWRGVRDLTLIAFLLTTYGLLPVFGFGGLLAAMGLAASSWPADRAIWTWATIWSLVATASSLHVLLGPH